MSVEKTPKGKINRPSKKSRSEAAALAPSSAASTNEPTAAALERRLMIEREAYLRAERRGFEPGHELEDWLAAEHSVGARAGH